MGLGVKTTSFNNLASTYRKDGIGLGPVIRGILIDNARMKIEVTQVPDLTDNSTGVASATVSAVAMAIPTAPFDATSAGGAQLTATNAAFVKIENAGRVLVNSINNARARLGMPNMAAASGVQAAADTIPAQDKSVATANGVSAIDYATGIAAMLQTRKNIYRLFRGMNGLFRAMGEPIMSHTLINAANFPSDLNLSAITAASASATGASSISKTVMDAFLDACANNIATMALVWNRQMVQGGSITDLTDSSGGTASPTNIVAMPTPAAAAGAATTSSPKAGFDAQLAIIANSCASLAARTNILIDHFGGTRLTDNSGGTPSTTLAAQSANLTAVDGSSGTSAVDVVTAAARMASVRNNIADLTRAINLLAPSFGVGLLADASGGSANTTLEAITATGTGVGGATPVTMLDSAVDTWLGQVQNNIATLAGRLNAMTDANMPKKPLSFYAD